MITLPNKKSKTPAIVKWGIGIVSISVLGLAGYLAFKHWKTPSPTQIVIVKPQLAIENSTTSAN